MIDDPWRKRVNKDVVSLKSITNNLYLMDPIKLCTHIVEVHIPLKHSFFTQSTTHTAIKLLSKNSKIHYMNYTFCGYSAIKLQVISKRYI